MPNHEQLIPALCHYDLVGFQTEVDAANFARYLANECGLPWASGNSFHFGNRVVQIGTFPVGVETEAFARLARRAIETDFVREVLESLSGRAMIIGVDRLDYTKGIPERMNAFERFLTNFPDWRGKVTYLQITPRSRTDIPEYADMGRAVGEAVGRINGTYGEASWTPVRYINKAHSRTALAGLYRAARAGLVTPLRDGMNLVAKEFVAAQNAEDPGVLILSRFAGAAHECSAALLVNPYDSEGVGNRHQSRAVDAARGDGASATRPISRCWCATISAIGPSGFCDARAAAGAVRECKADRRRAAVYDDLTITAEAHPCSRTVLWLLALFCRPYFSTEGASAADARKGETLAKRWCATCHVVASDQQRATRPGAAVFSHRARRPDLDAAKLALFLLLPHPQMPDMNLSR